jgi:hypothetical protein
LQNHTGNRKRNGNLANDLKENKQDYTGLEYSQSMIAIAEKNENCTFIWGYAISILKKVDAIIITGRSTSYLTTNDM